MPLSSYPCETLALDKRGIRDESASKGPDQCKEAAYSRQSLKLTLRVLCSEVSPVTRVARDLRVTAQHSCVSVASVFGDLRTKQMVHT